MKDAIALLLSFSLLLFTFSFTGCTKDKMPVGKSKPAGHDTTPPAGFLVINDGAAVTESTQVTLSLHATDEQGVTDMQLSSDRQNWSAPEPYTTTKAWILPAGNGLKHVYVQYGDKAGNWSTACAAAIFLGHGIDFELSYPARVSLGYTMKFVLTFYNASPRERTVERIMLLAALADSSKSKQEIILDLPVVLAVPGQQAAGGEPGLLPERMNVIWNELPAGLRGRLRPGSRLHLSVIAYMQEEAPLACTNCYELLVVR